MSRIDEGSQIHLAAHGGVHGHERRRATMRFSDQRFDPAANVAASARTLVDWDGVAAGERAGSQFLFLSHDAQYSTGVTKWFHEGVQEMDRWRKRNRFNSI